MRPMQWDVGYDRDYTRGGKRLFPLKKPGIVMFGEGDRDRERKIVMKRTGKCLIKALRNNLIPLALYEIKVNLESIAEFCYVDMYIYQIHTFHI